MKVSEDEIREIARIIIAEQFRTHQMIPRLEMLSPEHCDSIVNQAKNILAAIEPEMRKRHRAELYAELIAVASNTTAFEQVTFGWLYGVADGEPLDDEGTVADWLRSRQEVETDER